MIRKKFNKNTIQIFLIIVIPVLILWVSITVYNLASEKEFIVDKMIGENYIYDENTDILIEKYMSEVVENLKVVRDADEFNDFISSPTDENYDEAVGLFSRIMTNKIDFDQLRYIDISGNEIIRIENNNDGEVIEVEELQNKVDRYYFNNTLMLNDNEIYISPLDLNVENGEIEIPEKPIIRFSTPIYNEENQLTGILIINYKADYFVELIMDYQEHENLKIFDFYILNKYGQYIINPNEEMNYSYMYEDSYDLKFSDDNNELWNNMVENNFNGSFELEDKAVTYYDVLNQTKLIYPNYEQSWIIVHSVDISSLFSLNAILAELFLSYNFILFIVINILALAIAIFINRLRNKDTELDISMKIAGSSNEAVIITDSKTNITYVNKAYEEATGYSQDEVIGLKPSRFKSGKNSKDFYKNMWNNINENDQWEGMLWDRKKNGLLYPKRLKILAVKDRKKDTTHHYVGIFSDLYSYKKNSNTYDKVNYKNGELVIPNEEMMIELLDQSVKSNNFNFMVIYVAIENYNQLISTLDDDDFNLYHEFSNLLKPLISEDDFVVQTGRNLFAIIIGVNNIKVGNEKFVSNLHKQIGKVIKLNGKDIFFKTKIGVSYWPQDTNDIRKLLLNSMIALEWTSYKKDSEIAFFNEEMIYQLNQENEIESHLRKALEKDEFTMVYQPQVDISSEKVIGMEALIRWNSKELGSISPAIFIPIAEKNHMMIEIGDWIIERVCKDLSEMKSLGSDFDSEFRCAINLSAIQMEEFGFVDKLFKYIDKYKLEPNQIEVEITESLLLSNERKNVTTLDKIRERGVTVAIDDFGTGYSSLSYLHTLPIDKIKVDRIFIKNYPTDDDGKLAKILVDMSKTLGMKVLTEGAETIDQIKYLREIGCDYIQGFYYSKPLSKEQFIDFVKKNIS